MRTTVDLPPAVHRRATQLAASTHQSLSATVADLALRGLATLGDQIEVRTDPVSGMPVINLGRPIAASNVADALDDE
jgi:hypothetical protein